MADDNGLQEDFTKYTNNRTWALRADLCTVLQAPRAPIH